MAINKKNSNIFASFTTLFWFFLLSLIFFGFLSLKICFNFVLVLFKNFLILAICLFLLVKYYFIIFTRIYVTLKIWTKWTKPTKQVTYFANSDTWVQGVPWSDNSKQRKKLRKVECLLLNLLSCLHLFWQGI